LALSLFSEYGKATYNIYYVRWALLSLLVNSSTNFSLLPYATPLLLIFQGPPPKAGHNTGKEKCCISMGNPMRERNKMKVYVTSLTLAELLQEHFSNETSSKIRSSKTQDGWNTEAIPARTRNMESKS
jgi:hypothetical protein